MDRTQVARLMCSGSRSATQRKKVRMAASLTLRDLTLLCRCCSNLSRNDTMTPSSKSLILRVAGSLRWSRFDGHKCGLENKRHDHEKEIFQFISPAGQDGPTQI